MTQTKKNKLLGTVVGFVLLVISIIPLKKSMPSGPAGLR